MNIQFTNKDTKAFSRHLNDISKYKLLSVDEEMMLAKTAVNGCQNSINKLVESNLRLVITIAKKYQSNKANLEDLVAAGNVGLFEAAKRYDAAQGFKFSTYARVWIIKYILEYLASNELIWIPINKQKLHNKNQFISLNTSYDDNQQLIDFIENKESESPIQLEDENKIKVEFITGKLKPAEREIINMYYGLNGESFSIIQISKKLGVSHQAIHSRITKIISKLKNEFN